jgi:hypothetical protein
MSQEDVEGVDVLGVDVWAGHAFAGCVPGIGEAEGLVCDEEADLAPVATENRFPLADRCYRRHDAGVSPWRRITAAIAARSGGPPAAASSTAATSRK